MPTSFLPVKIYDSAVNASLPHAIIGQDKGILESSFFKYFSAQNLNVWGCDENEMRTFESGHSHFAIFVHRISPDNSSSSIRCRVFLKYCSFLIFSFSQQSITAE